MTLFALFMAGVAFLRPQELCGRVTNLTLVPPYDGAVHHLVVLSMPDGQIMNGKVTEAVWVDLKLGQNFCFTVEGE